MDDSTEPNKRVKRYHKRSTWACDECKLRKKKCDGLQPCSKCTVYGKGCTYESKTRPSQPPTQRIRDLEDDLRAVREVLGKIRPVLTGSALTEVEQLLSGLRPAVNGQMSVSSPVVCTTASVAPDEATVHSMLTGRGRLMQRDDKTFFHGPYSGAALICSILEFFEKTNSEAMHPYITDLFDEESADPTDQCIEHSEASSLPDRTEANALLRVVLARRHPFLHFLDASALSHVYETIYSTTSNTPKQNALVLYHAILALGYLMDVPRHREQSCEHTIAQAWVVQNIIDRISDESAVQVISPFRAEAFELYLISTSQLSAAYTHIAVASTSAIKQGLHVTAEVVTSSGKSLQSVQAELLTALVDIDLYVSTTLGLPPLVNIDTAGSVLAGAREPTAAINQTFFSQRAMERNLLTTSGSLASKYSQIISLTAGVLWDLSASSSNSTDPGVILGASDARIVKQAERDLITWLKSLGFGIFPSTLDTKDATAKSSLPMYELEMAYYWCQLSIYSPFLHYLRPLADGQAILEASSRPALSCLKVAANTISRCETRLRHTMSGIPEPDNIQPDDCSCIYTLFLAVVSLIFLISIHEGTSKPSEAWRKADAGIRILAALRCGRNTATRCLDIIKELVRQLNYTVDFDIVEIELSTTRVCQGSHGVRPNLRNSELSQDSDMLENFWTMYDEDTFTVKDQMQTTSALSSADMMLAIARQLPIEVPLDKLTKFEAG